MSANPRTSYAPGRSWRSPWTKPDQVEAVRQYCNKVNPTSPGGCPCSYPQCHHQSCSAEIKGALRQLAKKENA